MVTSFFCASFFIKLLARQGVKLTITVERPKLKKSCDRKWRNVS